MKSLFLEKDGKTISMGTHDTLRQIMAIVSAYRENNQMPNYYTRFINEERNGEWVTCVDFGSWGEFFYIIPALNFSEEFTKRDD